MDFLKQQDDRRRQSTLLLGAFVAAILGMGLVIHSIIAGLSLMLTGSGSFWVPTIQGSVMIGIVWFTILAGGYFRYLDVKAGGAVLARRFGAVHASDRSRYEQEKQLLNVVAEISIASGTPQPEVYVLRGESSINALVLGSEQANHVIVLTQGALDAFDRDELQAVVAHEFGHISNGDLPLNMRLLIMLGGLMAIDEVGRLLMTKGPEGLAHPAMLVGYVLKVIGSVGVFFGKIIRAAFSRQREFLADASAVQFTRDPYPLASALQVIREHEHQPKLNLAHAEELAHLCFQSGLKFAWYQRLLASHPEIQTRMDAIEPHFSTKRRKAEKNSKAADAQTGTTAGVSAGPQFGLDAERPGSANIESNVISLFGGELSDRILLLLPDQQSCLAALFALFATGDSNSKRQYYNSLAFSFNDAFSEETRRVQSLIPDELKNNQLNIINHVTSVLSKSVSADSLQKIVLRLEKLTSVKDDYNLMMYASIQLIRRKLNVEFPVVDKVVNSNDQTANARRAKSFDSMGSEFALLLSLMVESSGTSAAELDAQFQSVLKCYTKTSYPRRTANETGIILELEAAFQTLLVQPVAIRQAFVQHCVEIMQQDGYIVPNERALVMLFAASLGCETVLAA